MYVNGYIVAVPEDKKDAYIEISEKFSKMLIDNGALEIFENWEVDVPDGETTDFRRAVNNLFQKRGVLMFLIIFLVNRNIVMPIIRRKINNLHLAMQIRDNILRSLMGQGEEHNITIRTNFIVVGARHRIVQMG